MFKSIECARMLDEQNIVLTLFFGQTHNENEFLPAVHSFVRVVRITHSSVDQ